MWANAVPILIIGDTLSWAFDARTAWLARAGLLFRCLGMLLWWSGRDCYLERRKQLTLVVMLITLFGCRDTNYNYSERALSVRSQDFHLILVLSLLLS